MGERITITKEMIRKLKGRIHFAIDCRISMISSFIKLFIDVNLECLTYDARSSFIALSPFSYIEFHREFQNEKDFYNRSIYGDGSIYTGQYLK